VAGDATIAGNLILRNRLVDASSSTGSVGQLLMATATGTQWVSTSTLGIVGGGGTPLATTTLIAGSGITFTGGTPVILGSTPITIESTGGGGSTGGGWSTTTDGANTITFTNNNVGIGGNSSTTAEIYFNSQFGYQQFSSTTNTNATMTIASVNNSQSIQLGAGTTTGTGLTLTRGAVFNFASTSQAITSFIGGITEWFIQIARVVFTGNVFVQGQLHVATTTYQGGTTTDALIVNGSINNGLWVLEECTSPMAEITQVGADVLRGCNRYSYLEDSNGVIDFVRPTTGSSTYFRLRPGATGVTTAAGDGMAIGWADGLDMGDLHKKRPAMEFALKQDNLANATATVIYAGITDRVTVGVQADVEPTVGFYMFASSTANWLFACNPNAGATQYFDTGIATSTFATGNINPWSWFRIEVGGTSNTAVAAKLKAATQANPIMTNIASCTIDLAASTAAAAPIVAIGKTTVGASPEVHTNMLRFWSLNPLW
jgi:hypothetical protein